MSDKEFSITMACGLLGFEEVLDYTLKPIPNNPCFFWLEAKDGPSFILTKPIFFFPDYQVQVKRETIANLLKDNQLPEIFLIVTIPERPADMTANLLAPLLVNEDTGLAGQIVMHDTSYTTRHFLFPPEKRCSCG